MKTSLTVRWMAVLALGLCSACTNNTATKTAQPTAASLYAPVQWDVATAAQNAATVTNKGLIMMR